MEVAQLNFGVHSLERFFLRDHPVIVDDTYCMCCMAMMVVCCHLGTWTPASRTTLKTSLGFHCVVLHILQICVTGGPLSHCVK